MSGWVVLHPSSPPFKKSWLHTMFMAAREANTSTKTATWDDLFENAQGVYWELRGYLVTCNSFEQAFDAGVVGWNEDEKICKVEKKCSKGIAQRN
ncbi:predicted protein [Sclerotinia sclerotiorum 1980 UF-70]|uniref:Uncharacterized protein n=1 Tax=Sclerotinia sclerotiorum (strain ATCC 18683 / 1980 / Ss-1) TaxID=665079 RepID=A7EXW9_SCLS1|nr:predicted protein [Sclerotinia sclerotiorum 1980 UF-70]EDN94311.1 predicted protein [Sclerotinia sclerotiorum 1980 UF-70]